MRRVLKTVLILLSAGCFLFLSGCKLAILNPKGVVAAQETKFLIDATFIMLIIVIPTILLSLYVAWRYSAKRKNAKYSPEWSHSTVLEVIWWAIPCCIIVFLATIAWVGAHKLDPYRPIVAKAKPMTIQAISLNWKWLFIYPKLGIATVNFVEFPKDVPVEFQLTSDGPMNSFQITQLAGQIYTMAGMRTRLHILSSHPGDYHGLSTSFSGDGFSGMHFVGRVVTQAQFDKWVAKVKQSPKKLTLPAFKELSKKSEDNPVTYYSSVAKNLFNVEMMKFMMPMPGMN